MEGNEESYKGRKIRVISNIDQKVGHELRIDGNKIHYLERGGRFWTRNTPYRDYSSLNELAQSVIDHSERIDEETSQD